MGMTREEAMVVLDIQYAIEPIIDQAFRRLAPKCHPDGPTPNAAQWARISEAKTVLLALPPKCKGCNGRGRVALGGIAMFCADCGGTGYVP